MRYRVSEIMSAIVKEDPESFRDRASARGAAEGEAGKDMSEASRTSSHVAGHAEIAGDHAESATGAQCSAAAGVAQASRDGGRGMVPTGHRVTGPFWRYFGGKWPSPLHRVIVEPFAGAAGYALRHASHDVILVDRYPVICEVWRWLIGSSPADVRAIPCVESTDDLPSWVPEGARHLVGFCMNSAVTRPCRTLSAGRVKLATAGRRFEGWNVAHRERVARNVRAIKHWRVIEGDYTAGPDVEATWFVDPPYQEAGRFYVHGPKAIDFAALGAWCRERRGQVIACENAGATWLPFAPHREAKAGPARGVSSEVVWLGGVSAGAAGW